MGLSISVGQKISKAAKKKRGRPVTGQIPAISIRVSPEMLAEIEDWAARQTDHPERSTAIRRLIEKSLKAR